MFTELERAEDDEQEADLDGGTAADREALALTRDLREVLERGGDTAPEAPAAPCYSTRNQEVPDLEDLLKLVAGEEDVAPKKNEDDPVTLAAALAEATSCLGRPAKTFSELAGLVWKLLRHLRCGPNGVGLAKARPLNWHQLAEMQGSQARTSRVAAWRDS